MQPSNIRWTNYLVPNKKSTLKEGHLSSDALSAAIMRVRGQEAYHCAFDLDKREDFSGYRGPVRPALGYVYFDFDHEESGGELPRQDVLKFLEWLGDAPGVRVWFSGGKGFHVGVPDGYFGLEYNDALPKRLHQLAQFLKKTYPTLDTSIYNANRKFRAPGSRHDKTGLHKVPLSVGELAMGVTKIKEKALTPDDGACTPVYGFGAALPQLVQALALSSAPTGRPYQEGEMDEVYRPFESFPKKVCIQRILSSHCEPGGRHRTGLILSMDMYKTGVPLGLAKEKLTKWAGLVGLTAENRLHETLHQLERVYAREIEYSYGCTAPEKASKCSGRCPVYGKLRPENRPQVLDAPARLAKEEKQERMIVNIMKSEEASRLIWEGEDLFFWDDEKKHWVHHDRLEARRRIYQIIERGFGGSLTHKEIESIRQRFGYSLESVQSAGGRGFFNPDPGIANFSNGALVVERAGEKYAINFREHLRSDFMLWKHPFEYRTDYAPNSEVDEMVCRTLGCSSPDSPAFRAFFELMGSCLVPVFPKVCFLLGPPKTGKSTLLLLAKKLVDKSMGCGVQPKEWGYTFGREPMIGKLVNICTDISTSRPIPDDILKQIEDQTPVSVNRKNLRAVHTPLPAIHLFGANDLPGAEDSAVAFDRRVIILRCENEVPGQTFKRDFAHVIWERGREGVLARAIEGIHRLCEQGGHYTVVQESVEDVQEWKDEVRGVVEEWLAQKRERMSLAAGGSDGAGSGGGGGGTGAVAGGVMEEGSGWRSGMELYDEFVGWCKDNPWQSKHTGLKRFYRLLRKAGIPSKKTEFGVTFGISVIVR